MNIELLPDDIISKIISYVRDDYKILYNLIRVNRRYNNDYIGDYSTIILKLEFLAENIDDNIKGIFNGNCLIGGLPVLEFRNEFLNGVGNIEYIEREDIDEWIEIKTPYTNK